MSGYRWEVWYGTQLLHTEDGCESREEAEEEARNYRDSKVNDYIIDGAEYDVTEFIIEVEEVADE